MLALLGGGSDSIGGGCRATGLGSSAPRVARLAGELATLRLPASTSTVGVGRGRLPVADGSGVTTPSRVPKGLKGLL